MTDESEPTAETAELPGLAGHEIRNRASWNAFSDEYQELHAEQLQPKEGLRWGTYGIPEAELQVLGECRSRVILSAQLPSDSVSRFSRLLPGVMRFQG